MDQRDFDILTAISRLETNNVNKISDETGIPSSTIHFRIKELRKQGIIKNDLFEIDLEKMGLNIRIITEVMTGYDENYQQTVGEKLSAIDGVSQVYFTMGSTDFITIATLPTQDDVNRLINDYASISEVTKTNSHFVIQVIKDNNSSLENYDLEKLANALEIPEG